MASKDFTLTQEYLKEYLDYSPITGVVTYRKSNTNAVKVGSIAGCKQTSKGKSYLRIHIQGSYYLLHRIIWFMLYGHFPNIIDHDNGNGIDNRLLNLCDGTQSKNMKNTKQRSDNTSGAVGVYWNKNTSKWEAKVGVNNRLINIGSYCDFNDAVIARKMAEYEHGFHKNHGASYE